MIHNLKNPLDLIICLKLLNVVSLSDEESEKRIQKILKRHLSSQYEEHENQAESLLSEFDDEGKVKLARKSFT